MLLTLPIREVAVATPRSVIVTIGLEGHPFPYQAGQAVLIARPGEPERRPYSIAIAPQEAGARGALELLVGVDSPETGAPLLGRPTPGDRLDVEGPLGSFVLPETTTERRFLFVAGGTGIAPLRAMLHDALARDTTAHIGVVYSARTAAEFAYGAELRALAGAGRIALWQTVTRDRSAHWDGAQGRIALQHLGAMLTDTATLCFLCGPHALVQDVSPLLTQLGVAPERIRVEDWGGPG